MIQEALTNVAKHAAATAADVVLLVDRGHIRATVRDNGRGFNVAETLGSRERGLGLFGMRERAQLAGGRLELRSVLGAGTTVTLLIPLQAGEDEP